MNAKTPRELVEQLTQNPSVLGLVRYGSRGVDDVSKGGDFDLFVFADGLLDDVESLHFYVGDIPVDLNLRRLADLQRDEPRIPFDRVLLEGEILFDRTGELKDAIAAAATRWGGPSPLTEHDIAMNRFCQQHVLDKVRGRLNEDPLYCEFLLGANVHWLVASYFRVRLIPFPGEKRALHYLATQEPKLHEALRHCYKSQSQPE